MKIMTILGTRPEIIRLSRIIPLLDQNFEHLLVHTGQNSSDELSGCFFRDLGIREPDEYLNISIRDLGSQLSTLFQSGYEVLKKHSPEAVIILGDTNSALLSIIARRLGIKVFHLEAGNRCYDDRVPEEVNRRIVDHTSSILLPYTHRSKDNLLAEGIDRTCIHVIGNPIYEVLLANKKKIEESSILDQLKIKSGNYHIATLHRAETVDLKEQLIKSLNALELVSKNTGLPVILSVHPRTKSRIAEISASEISGIHYTNPFNFYDFGKLLKESACVITDSGTVQEESSILNKPCVLMREVTERPELLEAGSVVIAGVEPETVMKAVNLALEKQEGWNLPKEYLDPNVAEKVVRIILANVLVKKICNK